MAKTGVEIPGSESSKIGRVDSTRSLESTSSAPSGRTRPFWSVPAVLMSVHETERSVCAAPAADVTSTALSRTIRSFMMSLQLRPVGGEQCHEGGHVELPLRELGAEYALELAGDLLAVEHTDLLDQACQPKTDRGIAHAIGPGEVL